MGTRPRAATTDADWSSAVEHASQAQELYQHGDNTRSAARAQAIAGRALRRWGRYAPVPQDRARPGRR